MADENGYNGWANYETWLVNLWLTNDRGSYEWLREMAYQCEGAEYPRVALADTIANDLRERADEYLPEAGLFSDLLGGALSNVDWHEIATHALDEVREEQCI